MNEPHLPFSANDLFSLGRHAAIDRGRNYFLNNRIKQIWKQENRFEATTLGSGGQQYRTRIWTRPLSALCSCPYSGGGACKHVMAMGMAILAENPTPELIPTVVALEPPFRYLSQVNLEQICTQTQSGELSESAWKGLAMEAVEAGNPIELMDLWLGRFEANGQIQAGIWGSMMRELTVHPFHAKEMLMHFFERWHKAERKREEMATTNPYQVTEWISILKSLLGDALPRQYVRIQLEGFSLREELWQPIWALIKPS